MFIITYRETARFSENDLVELAQETPKFRQLHDLLQVVCADAKVQLAVRHDLVPWRTRAATRGAPALAANVTICVAVLRRLMSWSYRTTMQELNVNAGWRWVCQLYLERVPNFRTIQNREAKLRSKTIRLIHEVVVAWGRKLGVTQAKKLRLDGSVTETNIHYPTDSGLLDDAARVLSSTGEASARPAATPLGSRQEMVSRSTPASSSLGSGYQPLEPFESQKHGKIQLETV